MRWCTIDPGVKHLALAVCDLADDFVFPPNPLQQLSYAQICGATRLIHWELIDLTLGRSNVAQMNLCARMVDQLDKNRPLLATCAGVGIEFQMSQNKATNACQNQLICYFQCRYPGMFLTHILPQWKTKALPPIAAADGVLDSALDTYGGRKRWSVRMLNRARQHWKETDEHLVRPELGWQIVLPVWRLWDETPKADDLADCVCMLWAWWLNSNGRILPAKKQTLLLGPKRCVAAAAAAASAPSEAAVQKRVADFLGGSSPPKPKNAEAIVAKAPQRRRPRRRRGA